MNLGIAINGEGRGHLSRAIALTEILRKKHHIEFWVPEHFHAELKERFPECQVHAIPYLKFIQKGFTLSYRRTILENKYTFLGAFRESSRLSYELKDRKLDALLSDFEPFCSRGAKLARIPVLQLNHPGVVTKRLQPSFQGIISQIVSWYMMRRADRTLICSFFDGDVGPIIRKELREKVITEENHIVVYQKKHYKETLQPVLENLKNQGYEFRIFPNSEDDYASALASCKAVVCPAGHQSISEALALKKPVFVIPVTAQFEQQLNAKMLKQSGFGTFSTDKKIAENLPKFLENLNQYKTRIAEFSNLSEEEKKQTGWNCTESTQRAADLVEEFLAEIPKKPEWKIIPFFDELRFDLLYANGFSA